MCSQRLRQINQGVLSLSGILVSYQHRIQQIKICASRKIHIYEEM